MGGRVIQCQRKGAGSIFTSRSKGRKGAAKLRSLDYAERQGFVRVSSKTSVTIQVEVPHSAKSNSKTHINTERSPKPWSAQKVSAPASSSTPVRKPPCPSVTSCQLDRCQKVPSFANWKKNPEIEVRSQKLPVDTAPSSLTTPTPAKPERNFHLVSKSCTPAETEPCSDSSLVVDELTNLCSKPAEPTTNSEVSLKIQSSIHTEEETINILVNLLLSGETLLQVRKSVLSLPGGPVESEVPGLLTTRKKNKYINAAFFNVYLRTKIHIINSVLITSVVLLTFHLK